MISQQAVDKIIEELKAITYDPRSHKGERLFRLSDIKKILNTNTEPEDEKVTVQSIRNSDIAYENFQKKVYPDVVHMRSFITGYLWGVEGLTDFPADWLQQEDE